MRHRGPTGPAEWMWISDDLTSPDRVHGPDRLGGMIRTMDPETKKRLFADLLHIAEETKEFDPPYIPSYYLQDVANSDPAELVYKYVLAKDMTDGYERLWRQGRLDLAVENVAWRYRKSFPAGGRKVGPDST
jgi:hypothetical protein